MAYHLQHEWFPILGEQVEIRARGRTVDYGRVDSVTYDDEILWLAADGSNTRRMVERRNKLEVWINYKWETVGDQP